MNFGEDLSNFEIRVVIFGDDGVDVSENVNDGLSGNQPLSSDGVSDITELINETSSMITEQSESLQDNNVSAKVTNDNSEIQQRVFSCLICFEGLTKTGHHKPASLMCGHIFGGKCIRKWIKYGCDNVGRCPTCNKSAKVIDIRPIDGNLLTHNELYKVENQYLNAEINRLKNIIEYTKSGSSDYNEQMHLQSSSSSEGISAALQNEAYIQGIHGQSKSSQDHNLSDKITKDDSEIKQEALLCPLCLESLTNNGCHKPAQLACGHIFGEKCIEIWIKDGCKNEFKKCPTCKKKAQLKDIRRLYDNQLTVIDTIKKYKDKNQYLNAEVDRLKTVIKNAKSGSSSTCDSTIIEQCLKKIKISNNPECRVMTYNEKNMILAVGHSNMISKLYAPILEPSNDCIYAHTNQIRDMAFHPYEINILASVSLDKFVKLIDMRSSTVVSHLNVDEALWSCCWAGDNPNILIAGDQMGSSYSMDLRFMKLLCVQKEQIFPCVSLVSLPPSSSRSFENGGFLKTRANIISVYEEDIGSSPMEYKNTQLPLEGLWSSCYYDSQSNLLLSSSKPCGTNKLVRHIVSKISDFNVEGPLINPVATFLGGNKATQLSRSCIVTSNRRNEDSIVCYYDENTSNVKLFSVNSGINIHNFEVEENIVDLCPLNGVVTNGKRIVAGLSKTSINIFSV